MSGALGGTLSYLNSKQPLSRDKESNAVVRSSTNCRIDLQRGERCYLTLRVRMSSKAKSIRL